ncbi:MAG: hypothetical protein JWL82_173 [Parcubacteria group bacterium]|nr:hypothetical protein [Parcubacteria group bacterium]
MIARIIDSLYNPTIMPANDDMLARIRTTLTALGYSITEDQPHISGERAHLSVKKQVLLGKNAAGVPVVIKTSDHPDGIKEILQEKTARDVLKRLSFAMDELLQAEELFSGSEDGRYFLITSYIPQESIFVIRPIEEQFFLALRAFEAQEAFHATTYGHAREIRNAFEVYTAVTYLDSFHGFLESVRRYTSNPRLDAALVRGSRFLEENAVVIERYGNYLTHTDFVPHNMRLHGRAIYALDLASVRFGNKYEGWGRFLNYMTAHNPPLERMLITYLRKNRPEEYLAVRLMRVYKLGYLLAYYAGLLPITTGNHLKITELRIELWTTVLEEVLDEHPVPDEVVQKYTHARNALRSEEEKRRQREFAET